MKKNSILLIYVSCILVCFASSNIFAEDAAVKLENKLYAGFGLGSSSFNKGGTGTGYTISLGYKIRKDFFVDLSRIDQGKGQEDYTESDGTSGTESTKSEGTAISLLGFIPIGEKNNFFGRIGIYNWEGEYNDDWNGKKAFRHSSEDGSDPIYGIGFTFNSNPNIDFLIEYDAIKLGEGFDANMIKAGIIYSF